MARRVAVIGAGSSGLTSIKCCLDEGLEPVCFESTDDIGGLWRFKTTVHSVRPRPDFSLSGQWEVVTKSRDGCREKHVFDGILVCSGRFTHPVIPLSSYPGIDTFSGECSHSWEYKDAEAFHGKSVVVVGMGNSGGDIAVEISRVAQRTFLSTREGAWVVGRMAGSGLPLDIMMVRRLNNLLLYLLPRSLLNWMVESAYNLKYDHRLYGLQPSHRILDQQPVINDDLPLRILQGALQMKPNIREFRGSAVVFDNGVMEEGIDAVVFCTGYRATFPFLPPSLASGPEGEILLYRRVFPLSLERLTLAILGLVNVTGSLMPVMEMQARWATRVFAGLNHLPPLAIMHKITEKEKKANMKYYCPKKAALVTDYIPYFDSLAKEVGVCPNILRLLLTDPAIGLRVLFGPFTPYQFRLSGLGRWEGARQAILTQWERLATPLQMRPVPELKSSGFSSWSLAGGALLIFGAIVFQKRNPTFLQSQIAWLASVGMSRWYSQSYNLVSW